MHEVEHEDEWETAGWAIVTQGADQLTHIVPVGDSVRHEVLVERRPPLRLRDGVINSCVCGPAVHDGPDGERVVLHHALDGLDRGEPESELWG